MFVGRRADGSIYGTWTVRQPDDADHPNMEELPDDHTEVMQFQHTIYQKPSASLDDQITDAVENLPT